MKQHAWYPVTATHPAPLVHVHGIVTFIGGVQGSYEAELLISRGRAPHADKWVTWKAGGATVLPSSATPCLWRPQNPEKWGAALPEPAVAPGVHSDWTSLNEATMARAIAEIGPGTGTKEPPQWWRDANLIRYEPRGKITPRMAEGRVMRAVAVCGHKRQLTLRLRSFGGMLADMAASLGEQSYATSDYAHEMRQLPADIDDFDTAMGWFVRLNPTSPPQPSARASWEFNRAQESLMYRSIALPLSFEVLGGMWGVSKQAAQQTYDRAIQAVSRVANGQPAYLRLASVCHIAGAP